MPDLAALLKDVLARVPQGQATIAMYILLFSVILAFYLPFIGMIPRKKEPPIVIEKRKGNETEEKLIEMLQESDAKLTELSEKYEKFKENPEFETIEKFFFVVNGVANAGLALIIAMIVWQWNKLINNPWQAKIPQGTRPADVATVLNRAWQDHLIQEIQNLIFIYLTALAFMFVIAWIAREKNGRSVNRIYRSSVVAGLIGVVAFFLFTKIGG